MKFRVGYEKIKGFSNPVKKAEAINDWAWWALFITAFGMEIIVLLKILGKI